MSDIAIVTDSTAYLSKEWAKEHDVIIVPLQVIFGNETFREGENLTNDEFYRRLAQERALPTTSQPSFGDMVAAFEEALQHHSQVLGIFMSSSLSGTVGSANSAAQSVEGDIVVIDSLITSYPMEAMVREAVRMRDAGKTREEIVSRIRYLVEGTRAFFIVDSLDHLQRGGRLSKAAALVGSLLQVKPILYVTPEGKLDVLEKIRTKKRATERVFELLHEQVPRNQDVRFGVVHSANPVEAEEWVARIQREFPGAEVGLSELGPVIGTHVGPGLVAVLYHPI